MSDDNIHHHLSSLSSLHNKIVENVFVRLCWFCQNLHQFSTCDIVDEKRCYDIIILYCIVFCVILFLWTKKNHTMSFTMSSFHNLRLCSNWVMQKNSATIWLYRLFTNHLNVPLPPHQAPLWMHCYIIWIF